MIVYKFVDRDDSTCERRKAWANSKCYLMIFSIGEMLSFEGIVERHQKNFALNKNKCPSEEEIFCGLCLLIDAGFVCKYNISDDESNKNHDCGKKLISV